MGNKTHISALVALAAAFAGVGVPAQAPAVAAAENASEPRLVLARGAVTAANPYNLVVTASLEPSPSEPSAPGTPVQSWDLPTGSVHLSEGSYTVELDPLAVPRTNMGRNGLVTLSIGFTDATTGANSQMITSARAVASTTTTAPKSVDGAAWVDPLAAWTPSRSNGTLPVLTGTGEQTFDAARRAASGTLSAPVEPTDAAVKMHAGAAKRVEAIAAAGPGSSKAAGSSSAVMLGGAQCVNGDVKEVWATVGTSYPIKSGTLRYSNSTSTTFGAGVTFGNGWSASGSTTTTDSWGQQFKRTRRNRSFRVAVEYQRQDCLLSNGYYSHSHTKARRQTGFTRTHKLGKKPSFDNCGPVAAGEWWRGVKRGTDYQLSYGVKVARFIGISLRTRRSYSSAGRLSYKFGKKRRMCGSNDVPAFARAITEKRRG